MRRVSIILCGCANNGSCMMSTSDISTLEVNQNGHYQWPCECSIFFGGDACEVDLRGCGDFNPCPDYSVCVNDSTVESGYVCDQCNTGFEVSGIGEKCTGRLYTLYKSPYNTRTLILERLFSLVLHWLLQE